jgi:hypothetical protein
LYCTWVRVNFSIMFAEVSPFQSALWVSPSYYCDTVETSSQPPQMNSKFKEYPESAIYHQIIIGFEFLVIHRRLR